MKSGIVFNQGDIIIVPFPFSDLSTVRQRPVLILSNLNYNKNSEDLVTCGITSNIKDSNYSILIDDENLLDGSIPIKSRIKVDKLFTLHRNIVLKKIGRLNKETFDKVKYEFLKLI
ncbi:type II toxin-antitoxin system PemK/MazF family toxin [Candidatus Pacearchaeota archaeon]|nr:type II toxin-antitoxin system PemK/MazF family toxin [Candidatus Pacearchaeota archaeon]